MSDENQGGAQAPAPTATNADATAAPTTTNTTPTGDEPAAPSHRDWNALTQNVRDFKKLAQQILDSQKPVEPKAEKPKVEATDDKYAALQAQFNEMKRTAELKESYADLGIKPGPTRELLELAVKAANPENVREFVEKYAATLVAQPAPTAQAAPIKPKVTTDTGAPAVDPKNTIPDDLRYMPIEVWKGMSPEERRKRYEKFSGQGVNANPWRARKESLGRKT